MQGLGPGPGKLDLVPEQAQEFRERVATVAALASRSLLYCTMAQEFRERVATVAVVVHEEDGERCGGRVGHGWDGPEGNDQIATRHV
ncbi:hypothetical protein J0H58_34795 [bacterium]|nr:hypothetical protein [bacterium]